MPNRSPALAAVLSFLFPGLGQVYAGETRRGLLWAIPMVVIIIGGLLLVLGGSRAISSLLTAEATLALIVFDLVFFLYHVSAMIDAYNVARRGSSPTSRAARNATLALAGLISLTIVI